LVGSAVSMRIELPAERASPAACRRWLRVALARLDRQTQDTVLLLASEVVTNALLHARSPMIVTVEIGQYIVRVEVQDRSVLPPVLRSASNRASLGRGLAILDSLAREWGSDPLPAGDGKALWFTVDRAGEAALGSRNAHADPAARRPHGGEPPDDDRETRTGAPKPERHPRTGGSRSYRLVGAPVALFERAWDEYASLMRELRLLDLTARAAGETSALRSELGAVLGEWAAAEAIEPNPRIFATAYGFVVAAARASGLPAVEVELAVPEQAGAVAASLDRFFDRVEGLCGAGGQLLTPRPSADSVALRKWLLGELVRQSAGEVPTRWPGSPPSARPR
jgi:anti-sigma regulatory factor (Ser/Thr protein kinase)